MEAQPRSTSGAGSQRRFSWLLFRHLAGEFLVILGCCLAAFLVLFLVFALMDDLSDFLRAQAPWNETLWYFVCLQPDNLVRVLPMSLMLATIYSLVNLVRHNEMTALRSMGVSVVQACLPYLLVASALAVLLLAANEGLVPAARRLTREIKQRVDNYGTERKWEPLLAFQNQRDRRFWNIQTFDHQAHFSRLFITQLNAQGYVEWELRADEAVYDGHRQRWIFSRATQTRYHPDGRFAEPPQTFATLELALSERPSGIEFFSRLKASQELSARELHRLLREPSLALPEATRAVLWTTFFQRLFFPLACVVSVLIGIPVAERTQRTGVMRSFVVAAALMALFYVTVEIFAVLGNKGLVPPAVGGGLPSLLFTVGGVVAMLRRL